jgi:hypothetical protein
MTQRELYQALKASGVPCTTRMTKAELQALYDTMIPTPAFTISSLTESGFLLPPPAIVPTVTVKYDEEKGRVVPYPIKGTVSAARRRKLKKRGVSFRVAGFTEKGKVRYARV